MSPNEPIICNMSKASYIFEPNFVSQGGSQFFPVLHRNMFCGDDPDDWGDNFPDLTEEFNEVAEDDGYLDLTDEFNNASEGDWGDDDDDGDDGNDYELDPPEFDPPGI